jgi:two-component system OmpR family response regulator
VLRVGDLEIDTVRRAVRRGGRAIDLKPKEYALLEFLVRNSDRPVTKSLIIEHVWNIHFDSVSNVVEVHVNALRNKIDRGFGPPLIHTIRGVGYMLSDTPPA